MAPRILVALAVAGLMSPACGDGPTAYITGEKDTLQGEDTTQPQDTVSADSAQPPDTTCVPDCAGRICGDNGCGGTCGECAEANTHCDQGVCVSGAPPLCTWGTNVWGDGCLWGP